jgi:hypothetical protein
VEHQCESNDPLGYVSEDQVLPLGATIVEAWSIVTSDDVFDRCDVSIIDARR